MNRITLHIPENYRRYFFVFVVTFFVLLTSCPVKTSIKTLVGLPSNIEQGLKANHSFLGTSFEKCINSESEDISVSQKGSFHANELIPVVLFTVAFLFLFCDNVGQAQSHPLYGNSKIPGSLPIFLQYRKLII